MSKKKNTLKDLDEFLKQQAATLVEPTSLRETIQDTAKEEEKTGMIPTQINASSVLDNLNTLAAIEGDDFRTTLYDLIIHSLESQKTTSAEDKMLINTALYLKSGTDWKEAIKKYWESHQ